MGVSPELRKKKHILDASFGPFSQIRSHICMQVIIESHDNHSTIVVEESCFEICSYNFDGQ